MNAPPEPVMKRFFVFIYKDLCPAGGVRDLSGTYDIMEKAAQAVRRYYKMDSTSFVGQILDTQTSEVWTFDVAWQAFQPKQRRRSELPGSPSVRRITDYIHRIDPAPATERHGTGVDPVRDSLRAPSGPGRGGPPPPPRK